MATDPMGASVDGTADHQHSSNLYTAAQVRAFDRTAIDTLGVAGATLMERAGEAALAVLRAHWPAVRRIAVVCGTGNNGGDGYVVALAARFAGLYARLVQVGDPGRIGGDARTMADRWQAAGGRVEQLEDGALADAEVIVDGLFGTGLDRELDGEWAEAVARINEAGCPVLALDLPSGLHADRGEMLGAAVRADLTVTFVAPKVGLHTGAGPDLAGTVHCADLGLPQELFTATPAEVRLLGDDCLAGLGARRRAAHKGDFGHVLIVGGDHGMMGAVQLAATAALRCGAGRVSVATRMDHAAALTAARPELMVHGVEDATGLLPLLRRADVVAIGPGLGRGPWGAALLGVALDAGCPLVIDADALQLLATEPARRDDWILTPHPGEAARLLEIDTATVQRDRPDAVRQLQQRYGGVAILKGAGTLVAAGTADLALCPAGNPGMATAGMGDVLTGVCAALRAQGLAPGEAARAAAWLHARAGDLAAADGERGLLAGDLFTPLRRLANPA